MPPCSQIGTSSVRTRRWSRTNAGSSPITPPASEPLAITPAAPAATARSASSSEVTSASTRRPSKRVDQLGIGDHDGADGGRKVERRGGRTEPDAERLVAPGDDQVELGSRPCLVGAEVEDARRTGTRGRHHDAPVGATAG